MRCRYKCRCKIEFAQVSTHALSPVVRISIDQLHSFTAEALIRAGLSPGPAEMAARVLVTTDSWGVFTHGTKSLRGYVRRLRAGGLRADAQVSVVREGPAWVMLDAGSGLAMPASVMAMERAIQKARQVGLGFAGVRNSCHFGAAGYYAKLAADAGLIGIAMANDIPSVTVPGARGAVLGSNPFAFAVPCEPDRPILLDMATSTVAGGKIYAAAALGKPIPEGWLTDELGRPTTDPRKLVEGGALTPMAGHKGYGIALLIETLSGVLTGASTTWQVVSWSFQDPTLATGHGAAFMAGDVAAMADPVEFAARLDRVVKEIRSTPLAEGAERILLPGDLEWERREVARRDGIELPPDVVANLRGVAEDLGMTLTGLG